MGSLHNLEQSHLQLEQQMADLDKMLDTWRKWETDYEILKEDIELARPRTPEILASIASDFSGVLLNHQEVQKLLTAPDGDTRTTKQVVDLIKHRLDYVKGNVDSISKRREAIEEQIGDNDRAIPLDMADQEGLPLTDIIEELDDQGNVISRSTKTPNNDLVQRLTGNRNSRNENNDSSSIRRSTAHIAANKRGSKFPEQSSDRAQTIANAKAAELAASLNNDDDEEEQGKEQESAQAATVALLNSIAEVAESGDSSLGPTLSRRPEQAQPGDTKVKGRDSQQSPMIPEGESLEDAILRREMLDYSLHEVGAVVAEMSLEEASDEELEELDELNDDDFSDEDDEEEEEDEYGRSIRPIISEKYKLEMLELERQLNAGRIRNLGPEPGRISPDSEGEPKSDEVVANIPRKRAAPPEKGALKKANAENSKPRGVRFADNLDVSELPPRANKENAEREAQFLQPKASNPIAEEVIEHAIIPDGTSQAVPSKKLRKPSRFKASRTPDDLFASANRPATATTAKKFAGPLLDSVESSPRKHSMTPEGPQNQVHAHVVERESSPQPTHSDEDGDDPTLQRRKIAGDYYAKRNMMIQAQGGFAASDPEVIPINDNGEELKPRVSRFKAARLGEKK